MLCLAAAETRSSVVRQVLEIIRDRELYVLRYDESGKVVRTPVPRALKLPEQEVHKGAPDQPPQRAARR